MKSSNELKDLAAALVKAQAEVMQAHKDATNPFFKSKYADLESVWDAIRAPLTKNGLSVAQGTTYLEGAGTCVVTRLIHTSGQWIEGVLPVMAAKTDPQGQGSAITYARRYALAGMVGVVQVDDDAEAAHGRSNEGANHNITNVSKAEPTKAQLKLELNPLKADCSHTFYASTLPQHKTSGKQIEYCSKCKGQRVRGAA